VSEQTRAHEAAGVAHMRQAIELLTRAVEAAERGAYKDASGMLRGEAKDRVYFAEIEMRLAEQAAKREKP